MQDLLEREVSFTTDAQRKIIRKKLGHLRRALNAEERKAIQFGLWEKAILRGFAAHHAGMFPALKELIEELTAAGFLSLIYATGTLALGINMPVRTVVLEELYKWNGDSFEDLSGTEYTQLIGRAGRRGKDQLGTAVILARPHTDIELLAKLSSGELERLNSVFFPSYNTVVNLIGNYGYRDARLIMGTSFAQYQLNSQLGEIQGKLARISRKIHAHSADLATLCQKGNLPQYLELRMKAGRASKAARRKAKSEYRRSIAASWREMQNGILYAIALAGEVTYGVVLSHNERRARIISLYGDLEWIYANQVSAPLRNLGEFLLPHGLSPKQAAAREIISQKLFRQLSERIELEQDADLIGAQDRFAVRETPELLAHPVHHCRDLAAHLIVAEEYLSLVNRRQALEAKADASHDSIARQFDAAAQVLKKLGFLQSDTDISIRKTDTGVLSSQNNPDCELRLGIGGDFCVRYTQKMICSWRFV
ncbi:hypothetical protein [Arcanobacterium hippocoleae]|uniref:hypothetical protein n=1 Tax=Arcanobacterium hippocoleae TaxID=149017 RepID=UPI0033406149